MASEEQNALIWKSIYDKDKILESNPHIAGDPIYGPASSEDKWEAKKEGFQKKAEKTKWLEEKWKDHFEYAPILEELVPGKIALGPAYSALTAEKLLSGESWEQGFQSGESWEQGFQKKAEKTKWLEEQWKDHFEYAPWLEEKWKGQFEKANLGPTFGPAYSVLSGESWYDESLNDPNGWDGVGPDPDKEPWHPWEPEGHTVSFSSGYDSDLPKMWKGKRREAHKLPRIFKGSVPYAPRAKILHRWQIGKELADPSQKKRGGLFFSMGGLKGDTQYASHGEGYAFKGLQEGGPDYVRRYATPQHPVRWNKVLREKLPLDIRSKLEAALISSTFQEYDSLMINAVKEYFPEADAITKSADEFIAIKPTAYSEHVPGLLSRERVSATRRLTQVGAGRANPVNMVGKVVGKKF